jgi:hypothetical protein
VTLVVSQCVSNTLKTRVNRAISRVLWVSIAAIDVALPDLYSGIIQRAPVAIEDTTTQVCNLTRGALFAAFDVCQVVVIIQRQLDGIERSGGLARSEGGCARQDRHGVDSQ